MRLDALQLGDGVMLVEATTLIDVWEVVRTSHKNCSMCPSGNVLLSSTSVLPVNGGEYGLARMSDILASLGEEA